MLGQPNISAAHNGLTGSLILMMFSGYVLTPMNLYNQQSQKWILNNYFHFLLDFVPVKDTYNLV